MVLEDTTGQDVTAESILERLSDLENNPTETLAPAGERRRKADHVSVEARWRGFS